MSAASASRDSAVCGKDGEGGGSDGGRRQKSENKDDEIIVDGLSELQVSKANSAGDNNVDNTAEDKCDLETSDDDELFAEPPPKEDCPICFLPIPYSNSMCEVATLFMPCCGKMICRGCMVISAEEMVNGNMKKWCLLCRVPLHDSREEFSKRLEKRIKDYNDADALITLADAYKRGCNLSQDFEKAFEFWKQAAELGSCRAHFCLGNAYVNGAGVTEDYYRAIHHFKLAAIGGHEHARYFLGLMSSDNVDIAMKHFIIAARSGLDESLKKVGEGYKAGHVTKEDYASTLRAYQVSVNGMKSEQRKIAATLESRTLKEGVI